MATPGDSSSLTGQINQGLDLASVGVQLGILIVVAVITHIVVRRIILGIIRSIAKKTSTHWDDALVKHRVFDKLSLLAPLIVLSVGSSLVDLNTNHVSLTVGIIESLMALTGAMAVSALLASGNTIYTHYDVSKRLPIKGYVQIAQIIVWVIGIIFAISHLLDESPAYLLSGLGAMTAVLLLIFKDTILSFVASVQILSNKMVQVGDWIEMPQYGADGDVIDIALHTVKVQNWDKTISTIPTYKLIDSSFKNWRGMQNSGGRRIKRRINIDISTIRFLSSEDQEHLNKFSCLQKYFAEKTADIEAHARA